MLTRKTPLRSKKPLKAKTPLKSKAKLKAKSPMKRASSQIKPKPIKMTPIRKSAKGEKCLVRIPGICNGDTDTTVLAHLNGGGTGMKASDHEAAYSCSDCHAWLDGGYVQHGHNKDTRDLWHLEAVIRTQQVLIYKGLMVLGGCHEQA